MAILPSIRARLVERFIFNFRFPPDALDRQLPPWLAPQLIGGWCVGSFCILDLDQVTFGAIPDGLGLRNINCALRFGVLDRATGDPAVYVVERNTNSRLGSFITSLGFPGRHRLVSARIEHEDGAWALRVQDEEREMLSAMVRAAPRHSSRLFPSMRDMAAFLAAGVRSYCPARTPGCFSIVDLHKEDPTYEPLSVSDLRQGLFAHWPGDESPAIFDSAVRTAGGRYIWDYRGQRSVEGMVS